MTLILYIIGAVVFIVSVIAGFSFDSFSGILISLVCGLSSAMIFFALARIIENQENILYKLTYQENEIRKSLIVKKICQKCDYTYDSDYSSCPHCGNKD